MDVYCDLCVVKARKEGFKIRSSFEIFGPNGTPFFNLPCSACGITPKEYGISGFEPNPDMEEYLNRNDGKYDDGLA